MVGGATTVGDSTDTVILTGTIAEINITLGAGVLYSPIEHFSGTATFSVTTNDNGNTGSGGPLADFDTFIINVTPIADAPSTKKGLEKCGPGDPGGDAV